MNFSFKYSPKLEKTRILQTIKRLDWFKANGYKLDNLTFPTGMDMENLENDTEEALEKRIDNEYSAGTFLNIEQEARAGIESQKSRLLKLIEELKLEPIPEIEIVLTKYGIGGSYSPPNGVIINISKKNTGGIINTLLHETIHLHIQPLIDKYKVGQWQKETLVELLFDKAFPELHRWQKIPIGIDETEKIKKAFEDHYPNLEKIIRNS